MLNDPLEERGVNLSAGQAANIEGTGQITFNRDYVSSGAAQAVRTLTEVIGDLADERALAVNNAAVNAALQSNIDDIDWGPIHRNVDKEINRLSVIPPSFRTEYALLCRQIQPIVEKLVKTITRTLKEENLAGERKGRFYGKKLDTMRLYRTDLRVWKDMKAPKKEINLAISLLLDESGSMSGAKAEITRLTAILFAEACEKLGIPLEINGHTTSGFFVKLFNYKNFDSFDRNDKYRLVDISARGCNRDGAAVIFGCERLMKRRENKAVWHSPLGGVNEQKARERKLRSDGKAISRSFNIAPGSKADFVVTVTQGVGKSQPNGIITPEGKPEVIIRVACSADNLKGLALSLKAHIEAYYAARYATNGYARAPKEVRQEQKVS